MRDNVVHAFSLGIVAGGFLAGAVLFFSGHADPRPLLPACQTPVIPVMVTR